ncbi:TKL/LISK/LISK-DD1 protein kinase [Pluteus cervinus]|uniref:TKL/LISK/LISK-DD1 protein kinase n=1 Tax=Pluteus cervinus TaxID=181527 RepID=A0ACD3AXT6_9AGAR|nr:TKL/LISK/LISK-DD1 protein kinase [Pluteus cervinus]
MASEAFDVIPFEDIKGNWKKLGAGSFGNVYKGTYLGIDVAIKEVLPSKDYDVAKYFEREWRLMKECRHPNICLFIGLSRAPAPDNRIFIISEFIENGNVRLYVHDKTKPFPWRLRLSFATDVTRALAYLHARKCIHRDLKGENLLVTANGRLKITDFGFARIAARNEEEMKRLTFCGTDSYMSPEILLGEEFDLPTDVFSLGIIFCEIASRRLADDHHFKRTPPSFGLDPEELHKLASSGCPPEFLSLCIDCLATDPQARPTTREILERLRLIEAEVLLRGDEGEELHFGSIRMMTGGKKPGGPPRIPSFGMGIGKDIKGTTSDDSDDELMEAVLGLSSVDLNNSDGSAGNEPLLGNEHNTSSNFSEYSTTVIRGHPQQSTSTQIPPLSSIMTIRPSPDPNEIRDPILPASPASSSTQSTIAPTHHAVDDHPVDPLNSDSIFSIATMDSYHTARSSTISSTMATEGGSTIRSLHSPMVHRFTLLKPGGKPKRSSGTISPPSNSQDGAAWKTLEMFFSSGLLVSKCDLCSKRIGWKPVLECDDCGLRAHVKCGEFAPRDCGVRPARQTQSPLQSISPLSRVKHNAALAGAGVKASKSTSPTR